MILGQQAARAFVEIDAAVSALIASSKRASKVYFNAHVDPSAVPTGGVIYNFENINLQIPPDTFSTQHEIWDFSARNVERWRAAGRNAVHVPVGFHASMTRFQPRPWSERNIDVVFVGYRNARRRAVLDALTRRGLRVEHLHGVYGAKRDEVLARSKVALNMLYYDKGVFPVLRQLHAAANHVAVISEVADEAPVWVHPAPVPYGSLVDSIAGLVRGSPSNLTLAARQASVMLRAYPLSIPPGPQSPSRNK